MSREILINDLRAKGEEQSAALWQEARAEVERFRAEADSRLAEELRRCAQAGREGSQAIQRRRAMAARRQAGAVISRAEQELSGRLQILARELLGGGGLGDRAALLGELAAELPPGEWRLVRVNPGDCAVAGGLFPGAEIVGDSAVLGGLAVTSPDGSVSIDNTLNIRLARIWSRLLPELLREVRGDGATG